MSQVLSLGQQKLFAAVLAPHGTAIRIGRLDGLVIDGGLFLGGEAIHLFASKKGPAFGMISNSGFDTCTGVVLEAGGLRMSNLDFATNNEDASALRVSGGVATVSSSHFFVGAKMKVPTVDQLGGAITLSGAQFESGSNDVVLIEEKGDSILSIVGSQFLKTPNQNFKMPSVRIRSGFFEAQANYSSENINSHKLVVYGINSK